MTTERCELYLEKKKPFPIYLVIGIVLVVIAAVAIFLIRSNAKLSESEQQSVTDSLQQPFSATATIRLEQMTAVADINRTAENTFTFQLVEPQALKDLSFQYNGSDITASYHGMSVTIGDDSMIAKALAGILFRSINEATKGSGVEISEADGILTLKGEGDGGNFTMQIDPKKNTILDLQVPSLDLSCEFSDFLFQPNTAESEAISEAS